MRAIHVDETGTRWIEPVRRPLGPGDVRVRVRVAAITGLDRDVISGRTGFAGTPGHAFVGEVTDVEGHSHASLRGRRVVPARAWGCGDCDACTAGLEDRCSSPCVPGLRGADGGHADEVVLPARAVLPVDDVITDEAAALLPIVGGVFGSITRGDLPNWTNVLVVGDGGAGLLAATALSAAGYTVTLYGRHGDRFDLVRRYRVNFVLVGDDGEEGFRPGRIGPTPMRYPYVVDASGTVSGWDTCLDLVSAGGVLFMMSTLSDGVPRTVQKVQEKSVHVVGLRSGAVEPAQAVVAAGHFDPTDVVRRVEAFEDVMAAYDRARQDRHWLSLLRMNG